MSKQELDRQKGPYPINRNYVFLDREANLFDQPEFARPIRAFTQLLSSTSGANIATLSSLLPEVNAVFLEDALRASNEITSDPNPMPNDIKTNTINSIVYHLASRIQTVHRSVKDETSTADYIAKRDSLFCTTDRAMQVFISHTLWGRNSEQGHQDTDDPDSRKWIRDHMKTSHFHALLRIADDVFSGVPSWSYYISRADVRKVYGRTGKRIGSSENDGQQHIQKDIQTYKDWFEVGKQRKEYFDSISGSQTANLDIPGIYSEAINEVAEYSMSDEGARSYAPIDAILTSPESSKPDNVIQADRVFDQPFFRQIFEILRKVNPDFEKIIGKPGFESVDQIRKNATSYITGGKKSSTEYHIIDQFIRAVIAVAARREKYLENNPQAVFTGKYLYDEDIQSSLRAQAYTSRELVTKKLLEINDIEDDEYIRAIAAFESIADLAFPYWSSYLYSYQAELNVHTKQDKPIIRELPAWWNEAVQAALNKKTNAEQERVRKHIGTRWEGLDDILKTIGCSLSALGRSRIQLGTYRHTQVSERFSGLSPKSIKEGQERAS